MRTRKNPIALMLACLLALSCGCRAQQVRYNAEFDVSSSNFADSIAIEWDQNQVYVPIKMGDRDYRFLLDTGSGQSVVYDDSPFLADCSTLGYMLAHDAIGRTDTVPVVSLPPLTLGGLTFNRLQATVQHRPVSGRNYDGIVGFDIVCRGFLMKIDVRQRLLVLTDRRHHFDGEKGFASKYRLNYHVPYVAVSPFNGFTEQALFDTGSRSLYVINRHSFDNAEQSLAQPLAAQVEGRSMGRRAIGNYGAEPRAEVVFLALEHLRVGGLAFTDVHTTTTAGGSHLGAAVLDYGAVTFDPRRKRMRFQPYSFEKECPVGNQQLEIAFVSEQGMPVVGLVWERSEPYQQGFREGDVVTAIDDRPVSSFEQFNRWGFEAGRPYRFNLRDRDGRQRVVTWVRLPKPDQE